MAEKTKAPDTALLVYLGKFAYPLHKPARSKVQEISGAEMMAGDTEVLSPGREGHFSDKSFRNCTPGCIYRLQVNRNAEGKVETIYPNTREYVGQFGPATFRAMLAADLRALDTEVREAKKRKVEEKQDPLDEILEPLLRTYQAANPSSRQQLIARVVYKLTTGRF